MVWVNSQVDVWVWGVQVDGGEEWGGREEGEAGEDGRLGEWMMGVIVSWSRSWL